MNLEVPIAFIVFNRIEPVKKVFESIRRAKPPRLYIISDAARFGKAGEEEKVKAVREYIESHVDWPCEVYKNYANSNMGCRNRIISGVSWCFETEQKMIILEDDCLPDDSFYGYAQQLLDVYADDPRVMHIGGYNMYGEYATDHDYIFSQRPCAWGWATWKRAWEKYDVEMPDWPKVRDSGMLRWRFANKYAYEDRVKEWDDIYYKNIDAWGYAWDFALMLNNAYAIYPNKNLIQNIGFGEDATHTVSSISDPLGHLHTMELPLRIRTDFLTDREYDVADMSYSIGQIIKRNIRALFPETFWKVYYRLRYRK